MAWYNIPGDEQYTTASLPPAAPNPSANARWPIAPSKGRSLAVPRFIAGKGPHGRCIGYRRSSGKRHHAGIDILAKHKDVVLACQAGTIVNFYYFYRGTYALIVDHGSFVINYSEVDGSSLIAAGIKSPTIRASQTGDMRSGKSKRTYTSTTKGAPAWVASSLAATGSTVEAGQQIALVGKMFRSSMLHFEMYTSGTTSNKKWDGFPSASPPSGLLDPTNYLIQLSNKEQRDPTKEIRVAPIHRT